MDFALPSDKNALFLPAKRILATVMKTRSTFTAFSYRRPFEPQLLIFVRSSKPDNVRANKHPKPVEQSPHRPIQTAMTCEAHGGRVGQDIHSLVPNLMRCSCKVWQHLAFLCLGLFGYVGNGRAGVVEVKESCAG